MNQSLNDFLNCLYKEKFWPRVSSVLMPPTFHIASLNCYTPKFSEVDLVSFHRRSVPSKVSISEKLFIISVFFGFFLGTKLNFPAKPSTFAYSMSYTFGKLLISQFIQNIWRKKLNILRGVTFLLTQWDWYGNPILHCAI